MNMQLSYQLFLCPPNGLNLPASHIFFPNLSGTVDTFRLLHPIRQQTTIHPSVATTVVEIAPDAARVAPDAPKPATPAANVLTSSPSVSDSSFAAKAAAATAIAIAVVPIVTFPRDIASSMRGCQDSGFPGDG
ncbi:hypothetical protein FRC19_011044 [Serendipita sp. 401]|nr:hypothetical protein FRC19_011044 [Serendipita sp. 401]